MDTFKFEKAWWDAIKGLPNDVRLEVYDSIVTYAFGGNPEGLKSMARVVFGFVKPEIDKQIQYYEAICERNRRNGSKGGRPCKPKETTENNPVGFTQVAENEDVSKTENNPNNPVGYLGLSGFSEKEEQEKKESTPTPPIKKEEEKEEKIPPINNPPKGESHKKKPIVVPDFVEEPYRNIFAEWLEYKKAKNQSYKDEKSLQKLYTRLLNLSQNDPVKAAAIVDESMAANYMGLFPLKYEAQKMPDNGVDWDKMVARFNRLGVIRVVEMDEQRKQLFLTLMNEYGDGFKDALLTVYRKIEGSNYLKGFNKSGWTANFEFVFTRVNFRKILEGFYDSMK